MKLLAALVASFTVACVASFAYHHTVFSTVGAITTHPRQATQIRR